MFKITTFYFSIEEKLLLLFYIVQIEIYFYNFIFCVKKRTELFYNPIESQCHRSDHGSPFNVGAGFGVQGSLLDVVVLVGGQGSLMLLAVVWLLV